MAGLTINHRLAVQKFPSFRRAWRNLGFINSRLGNHDETIRSFTKFVELGGGITIVAVICEDLARLYAVADLLRTVGPTLVLTVLLDGPQLGFEVVVA